MEDDKEGAVAHPVWPGQGRFLLYYSTALELSSTLGAE